MAARAARAETRSGQRPEETENNELLCSVAKASGATADVDLLLGAYALPGGRRGRRLHGVGRLEVAQEALLAGRARPALADRREQAAGTLSGGEQQMLAIGRALMGRPRLLALDEPSLGHDGQPRPQLALRAHRAAPPASC